MEEMRICKGCKKELLITEFPGGLLGRPYPKCYECRSVERRIRTRNKKLKLLNDNYYIYILLDPRTCVARYVGIAKNCNRRFALHLTEARKNHGVNPPKDKWIASLLELGLEPVMLIIGQGPEHEIYDREKETLGMLLKQGYDMLNVSGTKKAEIIGKREKVFKRGEFSKKPKYTPTD